MTTEPINTDGPFPDAVNCPLNAKALNEIKSIVIDTRNEVRELKDMNGPIASLIHDVDTVSDSVARAHVDIAAVEDDVEMVKSEQRGLIVKVGAILGPIAAAIAATIATFWGNNG